MLVTLRKPNGEVEEITKQSAQTRVHLGYYQYNFKDDVYEYTQLMLDEIETAVLKLQQEDHR